MKRVKSAQALAIDLLGAGAAAVGGLVWLALFRDRFAVGATWSGLNEAGGGPGFLLLLTSAAVSLISRSSVARSLRGVPALVHAGFFAALCGVSFSLLHERFLLLPPEALGPLSSGIAGAFLVPRLVVATLEASWAAGES